MTATGSRGSVALAGVVAAAAWAALPSPVHAATVERVSLSSEGDQGNGPSLWPAISADGRFVAFQSWASNLVPGDFNHTADIFVRDRLTGTTTRASVASDGVEADGPSAWPSISANGRFVVFHSDAGNLTEDPLPARRVFVHDRLTGETRSISPLQEVGRDPVLGELPRISADGSAICFTGRLRGLASFVDAHLPSPLAGASEIVDVYVHDRIAGTTEIASLAGSSTLSSISTGGACDVSADGNHVAFLSVAPLAPGADDDGFDPDLYVRDRLRRTTRWVSRDQTLDGTSYSGVRSWLLAADGRITAWISSGFAVDGPRTAIWTQDVDSGATSLLVPPGIDTSPSSRLWLGSMSADGRWVAIEGPGIELRAVDRLSGASVRIDVGDRGPANAPSSAPRLDVSGRRVAFVSAATNLADPDTNGEQDVFVRELPETRCDPGSDTLCLSANRFEVTARWSLDGVEWRSANATPLTADSGTFWFFDRDNVELIVKLLDACRVPDFRSFWFFSAGLTDVSVDLQVRDTATGESRRYLNLPGSAFEPVIDLDAFEGCGASALTPGRLSSGAVATAPTSVLVDPTDGAERFAKAVALHGDLLAVAAGADPAAYVFERATNGSWARTADLRGDLDWFYTGAVAVADDRIALGLPYTRIERFSPDRGAVAIFERTNGGPWTRTALLIDPLLIPNSWFGRALAFSGDRLVVGAGQSGAAHVYRRAPVGWELEQSLTSPEGLGAGHFGRSVDLEGDLLAIGAPFADFACVGSPGCFHGAVYLYELAGPGRWELRDRLLPESVTRAQKEFGAAVALDAGRLLVGAPGDPVAKNRYGRVTLLERDAGSGAWNSAATFASPSTDAWRFGEVLDLRGGRLVISAPATAEAFEPKVFVHTGAGASWTLAAALTTPSRAFGAEFGHALSLDDAGLAVGDGFAEGPLGRRGEVYLWETVCTDDAESVCLAGGRFRVETRWEAGSRSGTANAQRLTADSATFTFFDATNVELVVKVLDACAVPGNDSVWVFAAGLTDLGVELRVTDVETGAERIYRNPRGTTFRTVRDTGAFPVCAAGRAAGAGGNRP